MSTETPATEPMTGIIVSAAPSVTPFEIKPISFPVAKEQLAEVRKMAMELKVVDENDKEGLKVVRDTRLTLKRTRVEIEKTRKSLKDEPLRYGRLVDQVAQELTAEIEPAEEYLEKEEKRIAAIVEAKKRAEEERKRKLMQERVKDLATIGHTPNLATIGEMTDEQYAAYRKPLAEAFIERQRLEAEAAAQRQREQEAERERLRQQQAELERQRFEHQQQMEAERQRLAAERAELDRIAARQREEAERVAAERAAQEKPALQPAQPPRTPQEIEEHYKRVAPRIGAPVFYDPSAAPAPAPQLATAPVIPPAPAPAALDPVAEDRRKLQKLAIDVADINVPRFASGVVETLANKAIERCVKTIKELSEELE